MRNSPPPFAMVSLVTRAGESRRRINRATEEVEEKVKGFWFVGNLWTEVGDYTSAESRRFVNCCGAMYTPYGLSE
jgi:hypothetical protein